MVGILRNRINSQNALKLLGNGKYKVTKRIAEGGNGKILEADLLQDRRKKFAMKILSLETPQMEESFLQEISIMEKLSSKDIVKLEEHYIVEKEGERVGVIVLDRMQTDLMEFIHESRFTHGEIKRTFQKMCKIVHKCHKRGVYHLDLKPENFLVNFETSEGFAKINTIKLCDFGSSYDLRSSLLPSRFGTDYYKAPEVVFYSEADELNINPEKLDVWSLGVILYIMYTGVYPFIVERNSLHCRGLQEVKEIAGDNAYRLISAIFQSYIKNRPTLKKVLKHPFFKEQESNTDVAFPCRNMRNIW